MEKIWYYAESGQQVGPYSENEMRSLLENGKISAETAVWKNGMGEWQPMGQISEFAQPSEAPPPPVAGASEDEPNSSLRLGAGKQYDSVNQQDEDPDGGTDVKELLHGQEDPKPNKKKYQAKTDWLEVLGLTSIESSLFVITLVLMGIGVAIFRDNWEAIVMSFGLFWILAGNIMLLVRMFTKNWQLGLVYVIAPVFTYLMVVFFLKGLIGLIAFLAVPVIQLVILFIMIGETWRGIVLVMAGYAALSIPVEADEEKPIYFQQDAIMAAYEKHLSRFIQDFQSDQKREAPPSDD